MLALAIQSRVAAARFVGSRVTGWPTARPSGSRGPQEDINRPLLALVVRPLGSSPLSSKVLNKDRARHSTRVERVHSRARVSLRARAPFPLAVGNRGVWASVPPWYHRCHRCLLRDDSLRWQGRPFQGLVPYKLMRLPGFGVEGVAVDEKEKCCLADLSVPGAAVKSVCPVTAVLGSGSGISPCRRV